MRKVLETTNSEVLKGVLETTNSEVLNNHQFSVLCYVESYFKERPKDIVD